MKVLIAYDTESNEVEIQDHGWREPYPGELSGLARAIECKPLPWWVDFGAVALVIAAIGVLGMGGVW